MSESKESGGSWIDERFGRFEDRIDRMEKAIEKIGDNSTWLIRLVAGALLTLLGHAVVSYIQMGAQMGAK